MQIFKKFSLMVVLVVFLAIIHLFPVSAMNTGLETEELSPEQLEQEKGYAYITLLDKMPEGLTIESFDVNEKGMVAIKFDSFLSPFYVGVYDAKGVFQYGYTYNSAGSTAIEWDGDNLNIYWVRSDIVCSVNPDAQVEYALKVKNTAANTKYSSDCMQAKKKTKGDLEYRLTNGPHMIKGPYASHTSYAQLIVENADGEKTVIYDAFENGYESLVPGIVVYLVGMVVIVLFVIILFKNFIKQINDPDYKNIFIE